MEMELDSGSSALPGAQESTSSKLVATVLDLMALYLRAGRLLHNPHLLADLCHSLAKGIDHAVANNEVPLRSRDMPSLLKKLYVDIKDTSLQVALMMLTMSVNSACRLQWFPHQETDDLLKLGKQVMKTFSETENIFVGPSCAPSSVLEVLSRYYLKMKMDHIFIYLEIKPGFRAYVADFHITRGMVAPKQDKIWLLVAQLDNMDTSSCFVTPPEANFLLNGKGIEGRTTASMDTSPQLPTDVTGMLKYGVNCLQAVGQFSGPYLVVIAMMSVLPSLSFSQELQGRLVSAALMDSEAVNTETPSSSFPSTHLPISCDDNASVLAKDSDIRTQVISSLREKESSNTLQQDAFGVSGPSNNQAQVNNDSHDNSGQFVLQNRCLSRRLSDAYASSIRSLFMEQNQQESNYSKTVTECLGNSSIAARAFVPVPLQPVQRDATSQSVNAHQSSHKFRTRFQVKSSTTRSMLHSAMSVEEPRSVTNELSQPVPEATVVVHASDRRPSGRMRGVLTGEAYSAEFNEFIIQRKLWTQSSQPPPNLMPTPSSTSSRLDLLAGSVTVSGVSAAETHLRSEDSINP